MIPRQPIHHSRVSARAPHRRHIRISVPITHPLPIYPFSSAAHSAPALERIARAECIYPCAPPNRIDSLQILLNVYTCGTTSNKRLYVYAHTRCSPRRAYLRSSARESIYARRERAIYRPVNATRNRSRINCRARARACETRLFFGKCEKRWRNTRCHDKLGFFFSAGSSVACI